MTKRYTGLSTKVDALVRLLLWVSDRLELLARIHWWPREVAYRVLDRYCQCERCRERGKMGNPLGHV
jgi:hypothetical protein